MAAYSECDIDRILGDYNASFSYSSSESKLKKRKIFIDELVEKLAPSEDKQ